MINLYEEKIRGMLEYDIKKTFATVKLTGKLLFIVSLVACFCSNHFSVQSAGVKKIIINAGKTYKIKKSPKNYTFTSNKPKIASVTKKGVIKAKKCGTCVIKVRKHGNVIKRYKVKVVKAPVKQTTHDNDAINHITDATPQPTPMDIPMPDAYFLGFTGTVSSIKRLDDAPYECYECVVDFDESEIQKLKDYFKDCPSIKRIICKSLKYYEVNDKIRIMIEKRCVYTVKDETTVELISVYSIDY